MNLATNVCLEVQNSLGYQSVIESLGAKLSQLDALLTVATSEEFLEYEKYVVYDYLWLMHDVIKQARAECHGLM